MNLLLLYTSFILPLVVCWLTLVNNGLHGAHICTYTWLYLVQFSMKIWILLLQIKLLESIFVDLTRLSYFRAVCDAASRWWNRNAPTSLHYLNVSGWLMLYIPNLQFWNVSLSGAQIGSCILFVGIISVFLKVLNILILLDHIYLALVDHRNTCLCLHSNFVLQLALELHRFGLQLS